MAATRKDIGDDKPTTRAATTFQRERLRLKRREVWIEFLNSFVPSEGQFEQVRMSGQVEQILCDPTVKAALHRALIAACDALEVEAMHDVRRHTLRKTKEG